MPAPKVFQPGQEPTTLERRYRVQRRSSQLPAPPPSPPKTVPIPRQKPKVAEETEQRPAQPKKTAAEVQTEAMRRLTQQALQQSQARLQTLAAQLQLQTAMTIAQAAQAVAAGAGPVKGQVVGGVNLATFQKPLPDWYRPQLVTWQGVTLQVDAMRALQRASRMVGVPITGGGFRSHARQVQLYQQKPGLAAPPGYSYHEVGLAIDVDIQRLKALGLWERARRALLAVGFRQFDPKGEPWHFSYVVVG